MKRNLKLIFGILMSLFVFVSCDESDDMENANKTVELSINGQDLFYDLSQEQFTAGFNLQSFNFVDKFVVEDDEESTYTLNTFGLASDAMMFPDSTVNLSYFSFISEDYGMSYEAGTLDMTLTVNKVDAQDQILDATFDGTFIDIMTDEEVTVSGEIKFGTN